MEPIDFEQDAMIASLIFFTQSLSVNILWYHQMSTALKKSEKLVDGQGLSFSHFFLTKKNLVLKIIKSFLTCKKYEI